MDATAASSTLAPWQIVKRTSEKRVRAFQYMTRYARFPLRYALSLLTIVYHSLHKGDSHFFNTVKITFDDLAMHYSAGKTKKRSAQWFHLGVSLAPLLQISDPVDYIRSLTLLMEEYEYEVSDYARQKMVRAFPFQSLFSHTLSSVKYSGRIMRRTSLRHRPPLLNLGSTPTTRHPISYAPSLLSRLY